MRNHLHMHLYLVFVLILPSTRISSTPASPIKTVVVVVMENRSFDHMLGWMKSLNPSINGVNGSEFNRMSSGDPTSSQIFFDDNSQYVDPDPGHSFQAIREQVFGSERTSNETPPMNGFVQVAQGMDCSGKMARNVMSGFKPDSVKVYKELVQEFAVFDRWFASVPASTQPNRLYVHSATSHGATCNKISSLAKGYPQRTIFDNLHDEGWSFGIYYQNIPAIFFYKNLRKLKYLEMFYPYESMFKKHAEKGKLPNYAVIEQRYMDSKTKPATDDHPSHDVYRGQMFIKEIYETLRSSPQWNQTLLIITYDEHGGFYDHVPTPTNGIPSPDGVVGQEPFFFDFRRLGVRVPTIMVSPWIEKGLVVHGSNGVPFLTSEYEHSSIPATMKKIFNMKSPYLTKRDEWAASFEGIFQTRSEPKTDCPVKLSIPIRIRQTEANEDAELTEFQQELVELGSTLNGDNEMKNFKESVIQNMTVRQGIDYLDKVVNQFFQAGYFAKKMGIIDGDRIVTMRPSLTTRSSSSNVP